MTEYIFLCPICGRTYKEPYEVCECGAVPQYKAFKESVINKGLANNMNDVLYYAWIYNVPICLTFDGNITVNGDDFIDW